VTVASSAVDVTGARDRGSFAAMFARLVLAAALSTTATCSTGNTPPGSGSGASGGGAAEPTRTPLVHKDHKYHARFEGIAQQNACTADAGCYKGGCGGEVCSAEQGVNTTCEVLPVQIPASAGCGCVSGQCIWYSTDGTTLVDAAGPDPATTPPDGPACGNKTCAAGEQCIEYYGIAGPSGPRFQECGIPCKPGKGGCPEGMECTTIADGPGPVCRRRS
jgi:eight-cysteine-cluster-containing protein